MLACCARPAHADDLNTRLVQSTFKITNPKSTATGFVLSRLGAHDAQIQRLLVTAAHVLDKSEGNETTLVLRKRDGEGGYTKSPLKLTIRSEGKPLWTQHPTADIAALKVTLPQDVEVPQLLVDLLADEAKLKQYEVHPGDLVRSLGYPHQEEANAAGFPLARLGCVATFPLTPIKNAPTFYADLNSFEGDSGGPVYLAEFNRVYGGATQPGETQLILGLVVGQRFLDEETHSIYGSIKVRHRFGLAVITPAAFVRETIDSIPLEP